MDYFCYVSQSKVDQLLATAEPYEVIEIVEAETATSSDTKSAGISAPVSIINAGLTYGRSDVFQTNRKLKVSYAQKLKTVLRRIHPNVMLFEWRTAASARAAQTFFFYRGEFVVDALDDDALMATLCSVHNGAKLLLDCSLRYFSDEPVRDGRPFITSTNYRFFKERMPLALETVFLLVGQRDSTFAGSPLYLKLTAIRDLML